MSKIMFTRDISSEGILRLYKKYNYKLEGKILAKIHSGEKGNQNYLHPSLFKDLINYLDVTLGECNTAYEGSRHNNDVHLKLLKEHGWLDFKFDLLDKEGPDYVLDIPNGLKIKKNYVGKDILNYDSLLVFTHFKGHPMGGFGGSLKQLSIGCASSFGKKYIHGAGVTSGNTWATKQEDFIASMADAAYSIDKLFKNKVIYINVLKNMSVDCDCCAVAEDPCLKDIGVLISTDPLAIDKCSLDLIKASGDKGLDHFLERVSSKKGELIFKYGNELGIGSLDYELIDIDIR